MLQHLHHLGSGARVKLQHPPPRRPKQRAEWNSFWPFLCESPRIRCGAEWMTAGRQKGADGWSCGNREIKGAPIAVLKATRPHKEEVAKDAESCQENTLPLPIATIPRFPCDEGQDVKPLWKLHHQSPLTTLRKLQLPEFVAGSYDCSKWYHGHLNVGHKCGRSHN